MAEAPSLEGVIINVDSPQVAVDAPISAGFGGIADDIRDAVNRFTEAVKSGSDEAMATLLLGIGFVAVGVYLWRRL